MPRRLWRQNMKKTFTANLNGTVFHIEEDAFDQLQRYLASIRARLGSSGDANEIMADIEARIAELLTERLHGRQAVALADVDHIKQVMGQPEDYAGDEEAAGPTMAGASSGGYRPHKRFYRDPDDKKVAGVLSGLGHYLGMDPIWLRILFVVLVLAGWGFPAVLYFVMWALVPEANTAAEKLEMKGEPVTVDNIKRMFEEGAERFKTGAEQMAQEAREMGRRYKQQGYRAAYDRNSTAHRLLDALGKVLGVFLLFISVIIGLSLVAALGGTAFFSSVQTGEGTPFWSLPGLVFPDAFSSAAFTFSVFMLCTIPVVLLMLASLWLLFRLRTPRWFGWLLSVLFILALALITWLGIRTGWDFRARAEHTTSLALPMPASGTLHIRAGDDGNFSRVRQFSYARGTVTYSTDLFDLAGDSARLDLGRLHVQASPDSQFHLLTRRIARARDANMARGKAERINSSFAWHDDTLRLSGRYAFPKNDKLRAQQLVYVLQVPIGGRINLLPSSSMLMHQWMDDDSDAAHGDMVGRSWTMTKDGLKPVQAGRTGNAEQRHGDATHAFGTVEVPNVFRFFGNFTIR